MAYNFSSNVRGYTDASKGGAHAHGLDLAHRGNLLASPQLAPALSPVQRVRIVVPGATQNAEHFAQVVTLPNGKRAVAGRLVSDQYRFIDNREVVSWLEDRQRKFGLSFVPHGSWMTPSGKSRMVFQIPELGYSVKGYRGDCKPTLGFDNAYGANGGFGTQGGLFQTICQNLNFWFGEMLADLSRPHKGQDWDVPTLLDPVLAGIQERVERERILVEGLQAVSIAGTNIGRTLVEAAGAHKTRQVAMAQAIRGEHENAGPTAFAAWNAVSRFSTHTLTGYNRFDWAEAQLRKILDLDPVKEFAATHADFADVLAAR